MFVAESGGPSILIACDILASGSLKGFITGKRYNRCKRIHSAMELLHFKFFLSCAGSDMEDLVREELSQILKDNSSIHSTEFDDTSLSKKMRDFLEDYEIFKDETRRRLHGLTAQIDLVLVNRHRLDIGQQTST